MLSATRFVARTARKTAVCPQAIAKFTVAAQSDSESASKAGKAAWLAAGAFAAVSMLAFSNNQAQCEATKKEVKRDGKDAVAAHDLHHDHHVHNTKELSRGIKVFTGTANPALAQEIVKHLDLQLGKITVGRFADGEVNVQVNEHIRGRDVYIVQPTLPPVNESLMELLLMISTMRRASARKITAIIPYYGYARQDRKMQSRVPISAADVARLLEAVGVDRVVAVDLHSGQIQGFFRPRVPVDNLEGFTVGVTYFGDMDLVNPVVVSPDAGGVYRAKQFRDLLARKHGTDSSLAMIIKQRAKANEIDRMDLVGNVEGCDCILVDDMVDTAGTLCKAVEALKEKGARRVFAFCSHGVLSGPAAERIKNSGLTELVILDTIPMSEELKNTGKITQLTVGPLLAQAISNIHNRKSISALFKQSGSENQ